MRVVDLYRRRELASPNRLESVVSREASFIINNWVFMVLLAVVFGFTMLPVLSEALSDERLTLGPKFFNIVSGPLALLLLFLTGVAPLIAWRRASATSLQRHFARPALFGLLSALIPGVLFWSDVGYWSLGCWGLCGFTTATIFQAWSPWRTVSPR